MKKFIAVTVVAVLLFMCTSCMLFAMFGWPGFVLDRPLWEAQAARGAAETERAQVVTDQDLQRAETDTDANVGPNIDVTNCRSALWMKKAIENTEGVSELISVLDRDFKLSEGGQWSEEGYAIEPGSVFWTDIFHNISSLPDGVVSIRREEGGWGVFLITHTSRRYEVPAPNGGGRWMRLCTSLVVEAEAVAPPAETDTGADCVFPVLAGKTAAEAVNAMDQWYDSIGYQFGSAFSAGDTIPPESIFWTDMGEGFSVPAHVNCLKCSGNWGVFQTTAQAFQPPSGGRFAVCPR